MKKGFMMIEICLVILGLILLVSTTISLYKNASELNFNYDYIQISGSCDVQCAIEKPIP